MAESVKSRLPEGVKRFILLCFCTKQPIVFCSRAFLPPFPENVVQTTGNEKMFIKLSPTSARSFQGRYKSPYSLREEEKGNTFLSPRQSTKTMREESFLRYSCYTEII